MDDKDLEQLAYSVPAAAKMLDIGLSSAWKATRTGQLPIIRFGKLVRVPGPALKRLVNGDSK